MPLRFAAILTLIVLLGCSGGSRVSADGVDYCAEQSHLESLTNDCRWEVIERIWANQSPWLEDYLRSKLEANDGFGLYKTQQLTNSLFVAAVKDGRVELVDALAKLYLIPAEYLQEVNTYKYYKVPGRNERTTELPLPEPTRLWLSTDYAGENGTEHILPSAQFLFLIANAIAYAQTLPNQSSATKQLAETYWPVLIDHYKRWVFADHGPFQVSGWGCRAGNYNMSEFVAAKLQRDLNGKSSLSYCNAVTDRDLWIIVGTVELIAAHHAAPEQLPLSSALLEKFLTFARQGVALIESRTKFTTLTNFEGQLVSGAIFDPGAWRDHPKDAYAGYEGDTFPTSENQRIVDKVGWDLNHATRHVEVFESLYRRRALLGTDFPNRTVMEALANQLAYKIFNGDFTMPLFTNFFDGSNGWFRINYMHRNGFGYAPYDMSSSMIFGSYGRWSEFNNDVAKIVKALWKMILSDRPDVMEHKREHYEYRVYNNFERRPGDEIFSLSSSLRMLPFLSSFPPYDKIQ